MERPTGNDENTVPLPVFANAPKLPPVPSFKGGRIATPAMKKHVSHCQRAPESPVQQRANLSLAHIEQLHRRIKSMKIPMSPAAKNDLSVQKVLEHAEARIRSKEFALCERELQATLTLKFLAPHLQRSAAFWIVLSTAALAQKDPERAVAYLSKARDFNAKPMGDISNALRTLFLRFGGTERELERRVEDSPSQPQPRRSMTPRRDKLELLRSPEPDWRSAPVPPFPSIEQEDEEEQLPALPTTPATVATTAATAVEATTEIRLPEPLATKAVFDGIATGTNVERVKTAEVSSQTDPALEGVMNQLRECKISHPECVASSPPPLSISRAAAHLDASGGAGECASVPRQLAFGSQDDDDEEEDVHDFAELKVPGGGSSGSVQGDSVEHASEEGALEASGSSSLLEYLDANEEEQEEQGNALPAFLSTSVSTSASPAPASTRPLISARAEPPQLRCKQETKVNVLEKIKDIIDLTHNETKIDEPDSPALGSAVLLQAIEPVSRAPLASPVRRSLRCTPRQQRQQSASEKRQVLEKVDFVFSPNPHLQTDAPSKRRVESAAAAANDDVESEAAPKGETASTCGNDRSGRKEKSRRRSRRLSQRPE